MAFHARHLLIGAFETLDRSRCALATVGSRRVFEDDCVMAWVFLFVAGVFEWGWPIGLKLGWVDGRVHWGWIAFSVISMVVSGTLLLLAQRTIPMGTAYAIWTGTGALGAFVLGILLFSESASLARFFFFGLILSGIIGLKMVSDA
jgi:quaternary ammonium compound-resistance protein SugE